jgi:hypothetical protein
MNLKYDPVPFVLRSGKHYHKVQILHALRETQTPTYREALTAVKAQQNPDGGWSWGYKENQPSAVAVSARTLHIILETGVYTSDLIERGVQFLLGMQRQDGGWSENPALAPQMEEHWLWFSAVHSVTWITGNVITTLVKAGCKNEEDIEAGIHFLERMQNEEGGWPSHTGSSPDTKMWNMEEVVSAFVATGRKDTPVVERAIEAISAYRDRWPEPVESPLKMFLGLGYSVDHADVKECIGYFIENQHSDGGWGYYNETPSDPTQTASWTRVLVMYGLKVPRTGKGAGHLE